MTMKRDSTDSKRSTERTRNTSSRPAPEVEASAASKYIRDNFKPEDRVAVVVINRKSGAVVQRFARAGKIAAPDCQRWLRYMNENNYEVYTGKYQVVWRVDGFTAEKAESLQRRLARNTGADPAATDSARVLRLPGFVNHKYESPYVVDVANHAQQVYRPENFPQLPEVEREAYRPDPRSDPGPLRAIRSSGRITQSERDWAYARRALSRGESREEIVAAIAAYRHGEKPRPQYYAEHTVDKAMRSLQPPGRSPEDRNIEKER
jgi:hypothetical protein